MTVIIPPGKGARVSHLADWLEMKALVESSKASGIGDIRAWVRAYIPERKSRSREQPEEQIDADPEVLAKDAPDLSNAVAEEIGRRSALAGDAYPFSFEVSTSPNSWRVYPKSGAGPLPPGRCAYVLCLLITAVRKKLVKLEDESLTVNAVIGARFQVAACLAVGGYLAGPVISFGFPRAEGTAFLPALKSAFDRFGVYTPLDKIPGGYPASLKDGGIDVIGWIDFPDDRGARLLVFGQSASGNNWVDKPIHPDVKQLMSWFAPPVFEFFYPAILMPFPAHHDIDDGDEAAQGTWLAYAERRFGIVFDRFRIASLVERATRLPTPSFEKIDGHDQLPDMTGWITDALADLNGQMVRAA